jgi:hypothetical protein
MIAPNLLTSDNSSLLSSLYVLPPKQLLKTLHVLRILYVLFTYLMEQ